MGLGGTGAQQSKDCAFPAGKVSGAPLRVSWFLVIFFVYQLIDAVNMKGTPMWVRLVRVTGNEFLLLLTVLCHEMGHGTMARRKGGDIQQVLLWPFGGICFTTRPQGRGPREKLVDDLWIVGAGPATHFPMGAIWLGLLALLSAVFTEIMMPPLHAHLVPFSRALSPCLDLSGRHPECFHTWTAALLYGFIVQAIQLNVMLFMFNVFFPMYPMDGAKLIVCSLQLFCGASARCAAKVLVYTSVPLAVIFIGHSLWGLGGGGLQPGITAYMGFMCLAESYKIWRLMKEERLYTHPLFELARSSTREYNDGNGMTNRLNDRLRDDEEAPRRAPQVQFSELKPFAGAGRALGGGGAPSMPAASNGADAGAGSSPSGGDSVGSSPAAPGRNAWLRRVEQEAAQKTKTVRQLEDERLAQRERERMSAGGR